MKIILLKDVAKVGRRNEVKDLADGYARNFIIARGLGLPADSKNIEKLKQEEGSKSARIQSLQSKLRQLITESHQSPLLIKSKSNIDGHLFAKIKAEDLVRAIKQRGLELDPAVFGLMETIKDVGRHEVEIAIAPEERGRLMVEVVAV